MKFLKSALTRFWPILVLFILEIILFATNYTPGTMLMGWDNLMPEFNFPANLMRSINGVWQTHRGLGLYDGMSHIANLLHTLFLWGLSFVLPLNLLRYFFIFLMHFLGGVGVYFLLSRVIPASEPGSSPKQKMDSRLRGNDIVSLIGALFYLLNLATIQMFYTPLEAFAVHFASLPWLALTLINYLTTGTRKSLGWFLLVVLLTTPQFFVTTFILPIGMLLASICIFTKTNFKHLSIAFISFLLINAFWLLPYIWGVRQNGPIIAGAKINQMSSGEAFARNQAFGDIKNVLTFKGFSFDFEDLSTDGSTNYLMKPWRDHANGQFSQVVELGFAVLMIVGLLLVYKNRALWPFALTFLIGFFFLANDVTGLREINVLLRERLPIIGEALRFPFTKFSLLFAFSGSILLATGIANIISGFKNRAKKVMSSSAIFLILVAIFYLSYPAFTGNFIYKNLRVKLPDEYLQLFNFMQKQDHNGRTAILPQPAFWSWKFYRWGYRGSGFTWYGLPQPTLDRAFDPWGDKNENYYWEISYALYSKNTVAVENVFKKYNVRYVLMDENFLSPNSGLALYDDEIYKILDNNPNFKSLATFSGLKVYEFQNFTPTQTSKTNLPLASRVKWTDNDIVYQKSGDYLTNEVYPSYSGLQLEEAAKLIRGVYTDPNSNKRSINFPSLFTKRSVNEADFNPQEILKDAKLVFDSNETKTLNPKEVKPCGMSQQTNAELIDESLHLSDTNSRSCLSFSMLDLPHTEGYLVEVISKHINGLPLRFALINNTAKHIEIETFLSTKNELTTNYFILPPLGFDGLNYNVYLTNFSPGKNSSINEVKSIKAYSIAYNKITDKRLETKLEQNNNVLVYNEAFDPGWVALAINTTNTTNKQILPIVKQLKNHVMVNNWANAWLVEPKSADQAQHEPSTSSSEKANAKLWRGWLLPSNQVTNNKVTIVIFFWPQFLEYIGFLLLPLPLIFLRKQH